jgi:Tol biopolymer transport system component
MEYFASAAWSPDGRSFALAGTDLRGRKGIFRADAQSGQLTPVFLSESPLVGSFPQWSPDGQSLFYRRGENGTTIVAERNLATNQEREIARGPFGRTTISPDGQWIATTLANRSRKSSSLVLISVKDGAQREILTVTEPRALDAVSLAWVPNGRGLVVAQRLDANSLKKDIWFVPIDGSLPRKLEIETNGLSDPFSVHPDGRRIAFTSGEETNEVWALEHFLPKKAP